MYSSLSDYSSFTNPRKEHFESEKIINLIIYNPDVEYERDMKRVLEKYLATQIHVKSYFITLREQSEPVKIEKNVMYIQGKESFMPGILHKTVKAMEYCLSHHEFDYMIRSNISTILDFSKMKADGITSQYAGCRVFKLQWLDPKFGIHDKSLWGTRYLQGTHMILTQNAVQKLVKEQDNLRYDVIDDVAIGLVLGSPQQYGNMVSNGESGATCYRNKTEGARKEDVERMTHIVERLINTFSNEK